MRGLAFQRETHLRPGALGSCCCWRPGQPPGPRLLSLPAPRCLGRCPGLNHRRPRTAGGDSGADCAHCSFSKACSLQVSRQDGRCRGPSCPPPPSWAGGWLNRLWGASLLPGPWPRPNAMPCFCCLSGSWPISSQPGLSLPTGGPEETQDSCGGKCPVLLRDLPSPGSDRHVDMCMTTVVSLWRVTGQPLVRLTPAFLPLALSCSQTFAGSPGPPESRVWPSARSVPSRATISSLGQCVQCPGPCRRDHCPSTSGPWFPQTGLSPTCPACWRPLACGSALSPEWAGVTELQRAVNVPGASVLFRGGSRVVLDLERPP